jgi:hypothetical protein
MSIKDKILALQDLERAIKKHRLDDENNVLSDLIKDANTLRREIQREGAGERANKPQNEGKKETHLWE